MPPLSGTRAAETTVPVGWVKIRAEDNPSLAVFVELGDTPPTPSGGYGGFAAQERDQREAEPVWRGFDIYAVEMDIVADNHVAGTSIEDVYDTLEALAGRGRQSSGDRPPRLLVDAAGVMPHDQHPSPTGDADTRWVISELRWDTDPDVNLRNTAGDRTRFAASLLLWKASRPDSMDKAVARVAATVKKSKANRTVTAKSGDLLTTIAARELGDGGRWREVATLNGIRDNRSVKAGQKIRIP